MVAEKLPDEQIESFKQMFAMMDKDQNGKLSFEELKEGFAEMGQALPDADIQMLMDAVSSLLTI